MKLLFLILILPVTALAQSTNIVSVDEVRTGPNSETFVDAVRNNRQTPVALQTLLRNYVVSVIAAANTARTKAEADKATADAALAAVMSKLNDPTVTKGDLISEANKSEKAREVARLKKIRDDAEAAYQAANTP